MCGGPGRRLAAPTEKPLFEIGGRPMVDRVRAALRASRVETLYAVVSPHTPRTRAFLADLRVIEAPGDGYVDDLGQALRHVDRPVLTVAADLPLLSGSDIDSVLDRHEGGSLSVYVPTALKRRLGVSCDMALVDDGRSLAPTGVNVVGDDGDDVSVRTDVEFAVNVNTLADARIAERLL